MIRKILIKLMPVSTLRVVMLLFCAFRMIIACELPGRSWKATLPQNGDATGQIKLTFYTDGSQTTVVRASDPKCTCGCNEEGTWSLDGSTLTIVEITSTPTDSCCSCSSSTSVYSIVAWNENCNTVTVSINGASLSFLRESETGIFDWLPAWLPEWVFITACAGAGLVILLIAYIFYRRSKNRDYQPIN